jgi:hypothetical protein
MDIGTLAAAVAGLLVGASLVWYVGRSEAAGFKVRHGKIAGELEMARTELTNKVHEWTSALNERTGQHAAELSALRENHRAELQTKDDEARATVRECQATAIAESQRQAEAFEAIRRQLADQMQDLTQTMSLRSSQHIEEVAKLKSDHRSELNTKEDEWRQKLRDAGENSYSDGFRHAEVQHNKIDKAFTVKVRPFVRKIIKEGIFSGDSRLEIGFQYQMYVLDVPCFDPHVRIERTQTEKKINDERVKWATDKALQIASMAISAQTGLPISLDRTTIVEG